MKKFIALLLVAVMCIGLLAACGKENEDLNKAKEYLYSLYVNAPTETATDLEYPARVKGGNTFFNIDWTVEILSGAGEIKVVPSENDGFVIVDVPAEAAEDIVYKLTATIKSEDGQSAQLVYEYTVPKFTLTTFAEYAAAADDTLVIVQGVVTGILSKTLGDSADGLYFQDNDGGYYAYNTTVDPVTAGVEIGMTVRVTGLKDTYNGTYEIVSGEIQIIDSNKNPAAPVDFTERYLNAADLKAAELTTQQSMLVTLKGVEITKQNDKYLQFTLGGKETYIYISSSNCPITKDEENTLISTYNEKGGYMANVTGLITLYNGSFYLTPVSVDAFEYLGLPEKSDAEKIEYEKGNLSFPTTVNKDAEFELPTAGATYDVAISWAVEGEGAAIVDGKLVLTIPSTNSIVTLTATMTAGATTETVVFEIELLAKLPTYEEIVDMAYGLAEGEALDGTWRLHGVIVAINTEWSEQYQNITVTIQVGNKADKLIECYRLKGEGAQNLQVGDAITVEGVLKNYKGKIEFDAGCQLISIGEEADPSAAPKTDVAYKFGMIQQNVSETDVYYLAGGMDGYYMATTTDVNAAIDVYVEATEGGYYLYTFLDGNKTYINMVVSGTHVNGAYEATASTVYTWDPESMTLVATVNDELYWFGTRNDKTYTTVGPCKISYEGFYCMFYPA